MVEKRRIQCGTEMDFVDMLKGRASIGYNANIVQCDTPGTPRGTRWKIDFFLKIQEELDAFVESCANEEDMQHKNA